MLCEELVTLVPAPCTRFMELYAASTTGHSRPEEVNQECQHGWLDVSVAPISMAPSPIVDRDMLRHLLAARPKISKVSMVHIFPAAKRGPPERASVSECVRSAPVQNAEIASATPAAAPCLAEVVVK